MNDVLTRITELRLQKKWTEYQLAIYSGLPQSTISSWYRQDMMPTVSSLAKICDAFDITLSQLFAGDQEQVALTESQHKLLKLWAKLNPEQKEVLFRLIEIM